MKWIDYIGMDLGIEGQWLRDDGNTVFCQCSNCESLFIRNFMSDWKFCPICGEQVKDEQTEPQREECKNCKEGQEHDCYGCPFVEPKDEPQTEEWYTFQDEQEYNARHGKE